MGCPGNVSVLPNCQDTPAGLYLNSASAVASNSWTTINQGSGVYNGTPLIVSAVVKLTGTTTIYLNCQSSAVVGDYAYVANNGANSVTKINLSTFLTVGSALAVGSNPYSIAIDPTGTYAYVANDGANTVTKINLSTFLTVGSALAVGSDPVSIAIDPTGTYAYVANYGASTVTKINLSYVCHSRVCAGCRVRPVSASP